MRLERNATRSLLLLAGTTLLVAWMLTLDTVEAEPRFWNGPDEFAYRRALNVTAPNFNVSYSNHQVPFTLQTQPLIAAGKMRSDCADLRVATDTGAHVPHWIESGCNSNVTRVWAEIPSLAGGNTRRFFLYYGAPGASSASSVNDTFVKDSIRLEVSSCPVGATNLCPIDDHASADVLRGLSPDRCVGVAAGIAYGYPCTPTAPGTSTQDNFASEFRYLFVPDVTGLWGFAVRGDNYSELATSLTDEMLTTSHSPIAEGTYADNPGETYENLTLSAGAGKWYSFVASDTSGPEFQRVRMLRPGGTYMDLSTSNFPGMIFRRNYSVVEPTYAVSAVEEALPGAPLSLNVVPGPDGSELNASWSPPATNGGAGIIGYRVWTSSSALGPWTLSANTTGSWANLFVGINTTRHVRVQAQTLHGYGVNATDVGTSWDTPGPVGSYAATPGNRSAILTWTAPTWNGGEGIDGYRIQVPTMSVVWNTIATTTNGANTSFTVNGLTNGTEYVFRVVAYNLAGDGDPSGGASVVPGTRPDPPRNLVAVRGNGHVNLTWTAGYNGSHPLTGYHIWSGASPGARTIVATTASGANTSFTLNGLTNGVTYTFNVTAINGVGQSASSNVVSARPATTPGPVQTTIAEGNGTITLGWSIIAGSPADGGEPITSWTLYEGTSPGSMAPNGTYTPASTGTTLMRPNGDTRFFRVVATNVVGPGTSFNTVTGAAGAIPYPPGSFVATAGNRTVSLSWAYPSNDGGRVVTHYLAHLRGPDVAPVDDVVESQTTWSFTGLTNGTAYDVWVTAVNTKGESNASLTLTRTPLPPRPDPPADLVAQRGNGSVTLTWSRGYNATPLTGYTIWRGSTSGAEAPIATTTSGANTSFTVNGLTNGETSFFNVTARTAQGMSASSNEVSAKPATIPNPPAGLTATRGNHSVTLAWTPGATGGEPLLGYDVYMGTGTPTLLAQTSDGANTSFTVNGLPNGVAATFQVRARNVVGVSAASASATATPAAVPNPPVLLNAARGNANVTLTWTNGAQDGAPITGTTLYQGTSPGAMVAVANLAPGATSHVRSGLTNGVTYHFALAHNSSLGPSASSATLSAKPAREPDRPGAFAAALGDERVTLTWTTPSNGGEPILGYTVLMGPSPGALQPLATLGPSNTSFVAMGLVNGATYHFRVNATNVVGSNGTATLSSMPGRVPDAPTGLTGEAEDGAVSLVWSATTDTGGRQLQGYSIYRAMGEGTMVLLDEIGANTSYVAEGLVNGQLYRFSVHARNSLGLSAASNTLAATPLTTPSAPQGVTATLFAPEIAVSWSAPANSGGAPVQQYRVYASDLPGGARWLVGTVDGATFSFLDDAPSGTVRHYVVRALNVAGEGPASAEAAGATPADPLAPTVPTTYRTCVREATTQTASCTPGSSEPVVGAAAGARHTCVLLASGRVDCYGDDGSGQSGDHLAGQPAVAVSAGGLHTCALLDDGNVDCWGNNGFGRSASYLGGDAIGVSAGGGHTCFVTTAGAAVCQGLDGYGQAASRSAGVAAAAAGGFHTCFLLSTGEVACQGLNDRGQSAGDATGDVIQVTAGGFHACALTLSQTVRCWGAIAAPPSAIQGLALELASGADHACARLTTGDVACWGATRDGQSAGYSGGDALRVVAGGSHACVLTTTGAFTCWGAEGAADHGQATAYPGRPPTPSTSDPIPTTASVAPLARREEA